MTTYNERWEREVEDAIGRFEQALVAQKGPVVRVLTVDIDKAIVALQALGYDLRDWIREDQRRTVQCPSCGMKGGHDQCCQDSRTGAGPRL